MCSTFVLICQANVRARRITDAPTRGYWGVVAELRQGGSGELRSISLADPHRFIYRIAPHRPSEPRFEPELATYKREWIGGVVALDSAMIRNIVVHNIPGDVAEEVTSEPEPEPAPVDEAVPA